MIAFKVHVSEQRCKLTLYSDHCCIGWRNQLRLL